VAKLLPVLGRLGHLIIIKSNYYLIAYTLNCDDFKIKDRRALNLSMSLNLIEIGLNRIENSFSELLT
jgi:hypothetical protein